MLRKLLSDTKEEIMQLTKLRTTIRAAIVLATISYVPSAAASGWTGGLTLTSVTDSEYSGEIVQITVTVPLDNSAGCATTDTYVLRDPNTIKGGLALLAAAFLAGRQVSVFVNGTCDAIGRPNITAVTLQ